MMRARRCSCMCVLAKSTCPHTSTPLTLHTKPKPEYSPHPPPPIPKVINSKHVGETLRVKLLRDGEVMETDYVLSRQHPLVGPLFFGGWPGFVWLGGWSGWGAVVLGSRSHVLKLATG